MSRRGRKPKPTAVKVVTGNPGKRALAGDWVAPTRRSTALPPPTHLDAYAKAEWKRLAGELTMLGTLTNLDRGPFVAYCQAWSTYRQAEDALAAAARKDKTGLGGLVTTTKAGNTIQNPLVGIRNQALRSMVKYAAEFGFTPSSRVRVQDAAPGVAARKAAAPKADDFFGD